MAAEYEIELPVVAKATKAGWIVRKVQWVGRRGAPDRVFFGHGRCVFIEFKAPGKRPEGQQANEIARLKAVYQEVYVIDNVAAGLRVLGIEK